MAYLLCKRFHSGPFCHDNRLETTKPEKEDCLKRAIFECIAEVWDCRFDIYRRLPTRSDGGAGIHELEPLDDLQCFTDSCRDVMEACYCADMAGLTCTICDPESPGVGEEEEVPSGLDDEEQDLFDAGGADPLSLTVSSDESPIPVAFGTVALSGNIIWISEAREIQVERTRRVSGRVVRTTVTQKVIDIALGLCEGEVSQLLKLWIGSELVIDRTSGTATINEEILGERFSYTLYSGSESQQPSDLFDVPFGRSPAYRGLSYLFLKNFPATASGGRIPALRALVSTSIGSSLAVWETSSIEITADTLSTDPVSGRIFGYKSPNLYIVDEDTLTQTSSINLTAIASDTLAVSSDESGVMYQENSLDVVYWSGENYEERYSVPLPSQADMLSGARVASITEGDSVVIFASSGSTHRLLRADRDEQVMAIEATFLGSALSPAISTDAIYTYTGTFSADGDEYTGVYFYAFHQDASGLVRVLRYSVMDETLRQDYSASRSMEDTQLSLTTLGCSSPSATLDNVVFLPGESAFILFFDDAGIYRAVFIDHDNPAVPVWTAIVPAIPTGRLSARFGAEEYSYISGAKAYSISFETGESEEIYDITAEGAPVYGVDQHYDHVTRTITYRNSSNNLAKILLGRASAGVLTLDLLFAGVLERLGISQNNYDLSELSSISVDGYLVQGQASVAAVVNELSEFFALSTFETSSGLKIAPLSSPDTFSIDTDTWSSEFTETRGTLTQEDMNYVRVGYFDTDRDSTLYHQTMNKNMMRDTEDLISGSGLEYSLNLFSTSTPVRRSAEASLLRRLRNSDNSTIILPPKYLKTDPTDVVTVSGGEKLRADRVEMDVDFSIRVLAMPDDEALYAEVVSLSGVTTNPVSFAIDSISRMKSFPVMFNVPPAQNLIYSDYVYVGLHNPEGEYADFEAQVIQAQTLDGTQRTASTLTAEAKLASLVTAPVAFSTAQFSTDNDSTLVLEFSKDIPAGTFVAATAVELYESFTKNLLFVGKELIQFQEFSIAGDARTVTFTKLFRGRFGTDRYMGSHVVGERCAAYSASSFALLSLPVAAKLDNRVDITSLDPDNLDYGRRLAHVYQSVLSPTWQVTELKLRKVSTGATSTQGMFFISYPRLPHAAELYNSDSPSEPQQITSASASDRPYVYILKSAYDRDTFLAAIEEGGYALTTSQVSTNSYIHRRLGPLDTSPFASPTGAFAGAKYQLASMNLDGVTFTQTLHLAVARVIPGITSTTTNVPDTLTSDPSGFIAEGPVSYAKSLRLLRAY